MFQERTTIWADFTLELWIQSDSALSMQSVAEHAALLHPLSQNARFVFKCCDIKATAVTGKSSIRENL